MSKPTTFRIWSSEEEQELVAQLGHYPVQEIARMHDRSVRAIEMRIEHMIRRMHQDGTSPKDLARRFHKSVTDIEHIISAAPCTATSTPTMDLHKRLDAIEDMLSKIYRKQKRLEELVRRHAP